MKEFDIKSTMPTVSQAVTELETILKLTRHSEKVIKIIHGYGSSGHGGAIKHQVRLLLHEKQHRHDIKAYVPGEAFWQMMGFDETIFKYKPLLENDSDYKKGNDGITYVIF